MAADEDRRAGRPDLVPVADIDERQRPREVDRGAEIDRRARPPAAPARTDRLASSCAVDASSLRRRSLADALADVAADDVPAQPLAADLREVGRGRGAADRADVLLVLEDDAEGLVDELRRELAGAEGISAAAQSSVSAMPGTFVRSASRRRWTKPTTWRASCSGAVGHAGEDDLELLLRLG